MSRQPYPFLKILQSFNRMVCACGVGRARVVVIDTRTFAWSNNLDRERESMLPGIPWASMLPGEETEQSMGFSLQIRRRKACIGLEDKSKRALDHRFVAKLKGGPVAMEPGAERLILARRCPT